MTYEDLLTATQIADQLDERPERVRYMIGKLRIKPITRAGSVRLFSKEQAEYIRQGLYNMQTRGV